MDDRQSMRKNENFVFADKQSVHVVAEPKPLLSSQYEALSDED